MGYNTDPTVGRWAWDYLPLTRCEIWWSSSIAPTPGAVCVGVEHYADTGFIATSKQDPEGALFPPAETCRTELVAWAVVLGPNWSRPTGTLWPGILKKLGGAPRGDAWLAGMNSGADLSVVAHGAVRVDVEGITDRTAVENHLVLPWRELLERARTSAAGVSTEGMPSTGT